MYIYMYTSCWTSLEQHLAPSLAEVIRIAFGLGFAQTVAAVDLLADAGARQRRQRRRRHGPGRDRSEPTQRRHRLSGAARHGQRMTRQRLLTAAGRRSSATSATATASPSTAAEFIQPTVMVSAALHL